MITKNDLYKLAVKLFPINRSITGDGVRETLKILKAVCSSINVYEVPTGTQVFDWEIPKEWNIWDAYIEDEEGNRILNFKENNLHIVGYSKPIDTYMDLEELNNYIHSIVEYPEAIPYITSYYRENFGFCMAYEKRKNLEAGKYHVRIDSEFKDGSLTYGEIILPGKSKKEVFISTYICHPSMANNELSGPCVSIYLAKWLETIDRNYTYRIIFVPETIGSLTYLSKNLDEMKRNIIAGFNITCVGDNGNFSYIPSKYGNTLADKISKNVLNSHCDDYFTYSFLERGSDERQYCSPGVDLPVVSIMRSKYGEYKEYHTSKDDLSFISPEGLFGSFEIYKKCINALENNKCYRASKLGEPHLGKYGLYQNVGNTGITSYTRKISDFLVYCDGTNDLVDISNIINVPTEELIEISEVLKQNELIHLA